MEKQPGPKQKVVIRYRKGIRRLLFVLLFLGLLLVAIPFAIQFGIIERLTSSEIKSELISQLEGSGKREVEIEDVDFNPFTGVLVIENLQITRESRPELKISLLSVELDWLPLLNKRISISSALLKETYFKVEQDKENELLIAGMKFTASDSDEKKGKDKATMPWSIGFENVHFVDNNIEFISSDFSTRINIDSLLLAQFFSWKPAQATNFSFSSRLNGAPISGNVEMAAFIDEPLFEGNLKIDSLDIGDFIVFSGGSLEALSGNLSTDISFSLSVLNSGINYRQEGGVSLKNSKVEIGDAQLAHQKISWKGTVNYSEENNKTDGTFKGLISLQDSKIGIGDTELVHQKIVWKGAVNYSEENNKKKATGKGSVSLQDSRIGLGDTKLAHQNIAWKGTVDYSEENNKTGVTAKGAVNLQDSRIGIGDTELAHQKVDWKGTVNYSKVNNKIDSTAKGSINLQGSRIGFGDTELVHQKVAWKGTANYSEENNKIDSTANGSINLQDSKIRIDDTELAHQKVTWEGTVNHSERKNRENTTANGMLNFFKHRNSLSSPELDTTIETAQWNGELLFNKVAKKSYFKAHGKVVASDINSQNRQTKLTVLRLGKLTLDALSIDQPENISLSKAVIDELTVAQRQGNNKPLIKSAKVTFDKIQLKNLSNIDFEEANIDTLIADLDLDQQGNLTLLDELIDSLKPKFAESRSRKIPASTKRTDTKKQKLTFRVGGIKIRGNSEISVTSAMMKNSARKEIQLKNVSIGEINNGMPQNFTPFKLAATINTHSKLSLVGSAKPFTEKTNVQIIANLDALELADFSPYIRQQLGYNVRSGQLDADAKIDIKENILDGDIKTKVHRLVWVQSDSVKIAKMAEKLAMPLDSALSLLRDKSDDIKLTIRVSGDVSEPDFEVSDAINAAVTYSLKKAISGYLSYAFYPYGLAYLAAEKTYDMAKKSQVGLEVVEFKPGDNALSDQSKEDVANIAKLMKRRPWVKIQICGYATDSDHLKMIELEKDKKRHSDDSLLDASLLGLAKRRASVVKSYLISVYKINAKRLTTCSPTLTDGKEQTPRVELLI